MLKMEENSSFFVDTEGNRVEELQKFFSTLSDSLYELKDKESDLIPAEISIKDYLEKCPFKAEYFKAKEEKKAVEKTGRFKDKFMSMLDDYLEEIRHKKYEFVTDGIETKKDISHLCMSNKQLKRINRNEREKTKGQQWFNMKAPEMTEELKNDLQILQMRSALDPKHFYKRSEMKALPKYFEIGQVVESPIEYHNSKNIRKRNKTLVDELMEDAEFQKFNKKKYKETMVEKQKKTNFKKFKKANKVRKN